MSSLYINCATFCSITVPTHIAQQFDTNQEFFKKKLHILYLFGCFFVSSLLGQIINVDSGIIGMTTNQFIGEQEFFFIKFKNYRFTLIEMKDRYDCMSTYTNIKKKTQLLDGRSFYLASIFILEREIHQIGDIEDELPIKRMKLEKSTQKS